MIDTREIGRTAEDLAVTYLKKQGYKILERNFSCTTNFKGGEVDIIAKKDKVIHFIEVKSRNTDTFGSGRESVIFKKQQTIRRLATIYLMKHKLFDTVSSCFDVIEITNGSVEHLVNCF